MSSLILGFQETDKTQLLLVGGKVLNLGVLSVKSVGRFDKS